MDSDGKDARPAQWLDEMVPIRPIALAAYAIEFLFRSFRTWIVWAALLSALLVALKLALKKSGLTSAGVEVIELVAGTAASMSFATAVCACELRIKGRTGLWALRFGFVEAALTVLLVALALASGSIGGLISQISLSLAGDMRTLAIIQGAMTLPLAVLVIWVTVRLSVLLPASVVTGKPNFRRAWELSRGRFWFLVVMWVAVSLLAAIIGAVAFAPIAMLGAHFMANGLSAGSADDFATAAVLRTIAGLGADFTTAAALSAAATLAYKDLSADDRDGVR
jgi:hypothetical protein